MHSNLRNTFCEEIKKWIKDIFLCFLKNMIMVYSIDINILSWDYGEIILGLIYGKNTKKSFKNDQLRL